MFDNLRYMMEDLKAMEEPIFKNQVEGFLNNETNYTLDGVYIKIAVNFFPIKFPIASLCQVPYCRREKL